MRFIATAISTFILFGVISCASHSKVKASPEEIETLKNLVEQRSFIINADWARPLPTRSVTAVVNAGLLPLGSTLNRIDLAGSESYLRIAGDSAIARFPYYGEQQMPGVYNPRDTGIEFKDLLTDFELSPNEKDGGYQMNFFINNGNESFQVSALMLPQGTSTISISSTHRGFIQYYGQVSAYPEE